MSSVSMMIAMLENELKLLSLYDITIWDVDEQNENGYKTTISPCTRFESRNRRSTFVAANSFFFSVGGEEYTIDDYITNPVPHPFRPLDTIHSLDTSDPNLTWNSDTMTTPRISPLVTLINDANLCIIGGTDDKTKFGEIFDLKSRKTEQMTSLPDSFDQSFVKSVFIPDDKRILLFTYDYPAMAYYDLVRCEWGELPQPQSAVDNDWTDLLDDVHDINCVAAGTAIYWFSTKALQFFAYDFVEDRIFRSECYEYFEHTWLPYGGVPSLVHFIGEIFYIVWADFLTKECYHRIHITKLRISKSHNQTLSVIVSPTRNYFVEDNGSMPFLDALLV